MVIETKDDIYVGEIVFENEDIVIINDPDYDEYQVIDRKDILDMGED